MVKISSTLKSKTKRRYKILHGNRSENGDQRWKLGKWARITGELKMCNHGFHCSKYIQDAMNYVQGDTLAVVEVRGEHLDDSDKECWREMRVIKTYKLDKVAAVVLAVASAELVLPNYEKIYPDDKRPRLAIEDRQKAWFTWKGPTIERETALFELMLVLEKIGELKAGVREQNLTDDEMATLESILYKRPDCIKILSKLRELRRVFGGEK